MSAFYVEREFLDDEPILLPMKAKTQATPSAAMSVDETGCVGPLVPGEPFAGFSEEFKNAGGDLCGTFVLIRSAGRILLKVSGVSSPRDIGRDVYGKGPEEFTVEKIGTRIGRISMVYPRRGNLASVRFEA